MANYAKDNETVGCKHTFIPIKTKPERSFSIASSNSLVDLSKSVSSILSTKFPPFGLTQQFQHQKKKKDKIFATLILAETGKSNRKMRS